MPKQYAAPPTGGKKADPAYEANRQAAREFSDLILSRGDLGVMRVVSTDAFHQRQQAFMQQLDKTRREEGMGAYLAKLTRVTSQSKIFADTFQSWNRDKKGEGAAADVPGQGPGGRGVCPLAALHSRESAARRFDCYMCGSIAQVVQLGEGLSGGILWGLGSSVIIIAVVCGFLFRSLKFTLLVLPPNLFPVLALYGVMGLFKIPISSGSAMVATIALGIAVNDTMHFVLHYQRLTREHGCGTRRGIVQTIGELGRPIVLTSVVHIAGFTVFLLTDFQPLYHFGLLSSAGHDSGHAGRFVDAPQPADAL